MKLLDDFSALHNFKQARGLNRTHSNSPSAYILEARLRRILSQTVREKGRYKAAKEAGLKPFQVLHILDKKVYKLSFTQLKEALEIWEGAHLAEVLQYLHSISVDQNKPKL